MTDRLITVAIHTYEKATVLKSILENEGIEVALQNVNLVQPVVSSGVRVRIHEADLPKALRIIESADGLAEAPVAKPAEAEAQRVLVPVDFSDHSDHACNVAFRFAADVGAEVVLLHAYLTPALGANLQLTNTLNFEFDNLADDEIAVTIEEAARRQLDDYARTIRSRMADGTLPAVKFRTELVDNVPEDAICDAARMLKPLIIIMGTRGAGRKEQDMVGSVAAEVLDNCRVPVFTVPDGVESLCSVEDRCHVVFFSYFDQRDLLALDMLYRLFPKAHWEITIMSMPNKRISLDPTRTFDGLKEYCRQHLPRFTVTMHTPTVNDLDEEFRLLNADHAVSFVAVPNRRRNIFSRLFNPGLAHRILFQSDIPMVVLPV